MLDGVPALPPLRLDPVQPRETPRDLLARAVAGAERLHLHAFREVTAGQPDRHTAGAFAPTAVAMATSHMATARILDGLLAATDRQPPEAATLDADQLRKAISAAETAFHAWLAARDGWRDIRVSQSGTASHALRAEATALATRMGRLTYTDLAWTPRPGASHTPRPIEQLAADGDQLHALLDGLQQLTAASSRIAVEHSRMIDKLASRHQLLVRRRTLPDAVDIPRPWTPAAARTTLPLRAAYAEAGVAAADSCQTLRQVMDTLHAERRRTMQPTRPVEHPATAHDPPLRSRHEPTDPTLREPIGPAGRVIDL